MKHFIACMLREFNVNLINSQSEDVDACINERSRQPRSLFCRTTAANVAHQQGGLIRLAFGAPPNTSVDQLPNGDRNSLDVRLHCIRIYLT